MLDQERMPRHVAIIMDGNGRWAKNRGLPRLAGHNAGMKAMKKIVDHSDKLGIRYLTVYAFSTENWKRSLAEVSGIFKLLVTYVNSDLKGLIENNVKVQVLGDYSTLPKDAVKSLEKTLEETKNNTGLQFNIALNYGGRDRDPSQRSDTGRESSARRFAAGGDHRRHDRCRTVHGKFSCGFPGSGADHPHQRRGTAFKFPAVAERIQ